MILFLITNILLFCFINWSSRNYFNYVVFSRVTRAPSYCVVFDNKYYVKFIPELKLKNLCCIFQYFPLAARNYNYNVVPDNQDFAMFLSKLKLRILFEECYIFESFVQLHKIISYSVRGRKNAVFNVGRYCW